jgi:hypothetical protein
MTDDIAGAEKKTDNVMDGAMDDAIHEAASNMPPPDFTTFVISLCSAALMDLGELENPVTRKKEKKLDMAKHTIDLLAVIKDKTKGNLTAAETRLVDEMLADLRLKYIKVAG